jgi:hypothetical protein
LIEVQRRARVGRRVSELFGEGGEVGAMLRTLLVAASGVLAGLLVGTLGVVTFAAANVWDDRRRMSDTTEEPPYLSAVWSALTDRRVLPYLAAAAAAGAVNGGIGAWAGWRGSRRAAPVVAVPLLLLSFPLAICVRNPSDSKTWGGELFVVVFVGLFVWVAGRVGQELGAWQRHVPPTRPRN